MSTNLLSVIEQQHKALILMLNYPESRSYLGRDVCSVADAALAAGEQALEQTQGEAIAWEATTPGYIKYVTDKQYRSYSETAKRWYKPYKCSSCHFQATEPAPSTAGERAQVDRSDAVNLARNLKENSMQNPTPKGICMLIDAVLAMDAALLSAPALPAAAMPVGERTDTDRFKNFHRSLCARFGYTHDEKDWRRDLVSLEEHIAALLSAPALPVGELTDDQIDAIAGGNVDYFDRRVFARAILAAARTQPVREPLADEELDLICEKALFCRISFQQFARSIEAAHGIK